MNKVIKSSFECYVYQCCRCGYKMYINKQQDQMKLFQCACKCSKKMNEWFFIGEGKYNEQSIHKPEYKEPVILHRNKGKKPILLMPKKGCE